MKIYRRYIALFLTAVFILFAVFQYNDPDPWLWMIIYGSAAIISLLVFLRRANRYVFIFAGIAYLIGALIMWPPQYDGLLLDNGYTSNIEEARESMGLLICFMTMGYYLMVHRKNHIKT